MAVKIYFAVPGAGKTTYAVYMAQRALKSKKYKYVITNFPCVGTVRIEDMQDMGKYHIEDSLWIIDEAGIVFSNRNWKALLMHTIDYLKYHRHYACDMVFFSQTYGDMDNKIRELAVAYYLLKKIGPVTYVKSIWKKVGINEDHQISDTFGFHWPIFNKLIWRPKYYKYFNSWERKELLPFIPTYWDCPITPVTLTDKLKHYTKLGVIRLYSFAKYRYQLIRIGRSTLEKDIDYAIEHGEPVLLDCQEVSDVDVTGG